MTCITVYLREAASNRLWRIPLQAGVCPSCRNACVGGGVAMW